VVGLQAALLTVTLGFGALLALQIKLPEWVYAAILLAAGLAVGLETDLPQLNAQMAALGVGVAVFLITMNAFALAAMLTKARLPVALRVVGAWMLAVSMMVLALNLRGLA
jgi:hydrogenase/urease accessory protein HupE